MTRYSCCPHCGIGHDEYFTKGHGEPCDEEDCPGSEPMEVAE